MSDDEYAYEGQLVDHIIGLMCTASSAYSHNKADHDLSMRVMAEMLVTAVMLHNHGSNRAAIDADLKLMVAAVRRAFTMIGAERLLRQSCDGHA
jgi:hypothetical protein